MSFSSEVEVIDEEAPEASEDEAEELYAKIDTLEKELEAAQAASMATVDLYATEELNGRLELTEELLHAREEQTRVEGAIPATAASKSAQNVAPSSQQAEGEGDGIAKNGRGTR